MLSTAPTIAPSAVPRPSPSTNERSIFERVDRELAQVAERRVAGAEVIEHEPHPERVEVGERADTLLDVGGQRLLGQLELEQARLEASLVENARHRAGQITVARAGAARR